MVKTFPAAKGYLAERNGRTIRIYQISLLDAAACGLAGQAYEEGLMVLRLPRSFVMRSM